MSKLDDNEHLPIDIDIETPKTEEEKPFTKPVRNIREHMGRTKDISEKDHRAFLLTCSCVGLLTVFVITDICTGKNLMESSILFKDFFDVVKYIITTSLGFFFATSVSKKS